MLKNEISIEAEFFVVSKTLLKVMFNQYGFYSNFHVNYSKQSEGIGGRTLESPIW